MNSCASPSANRKTNGRKKSKVLGNRRKPFRCFKTFMFQEWPVKTNGGWKIQENINKGLFGRRLSAASGERSSFQQADKCGRNLCLGSCKCKLSHKAIAPLARPSPLMKRSISDVGATSVILTVVYVDCSYTVKLDFPEIGLHTCSRCGMLKSSSLASNSICMFVRTFTGLELWHVYNRLT